MPTQPKTATEIEAWLVSTLATLLETSPDNIKVTEPLAYLGLNSVEAATISGDLSDWLEHDLDPNLIWNYPTITTLAEHLATEVASS